MRLFLLLPIPFPYRRQPYHRRRNDLSQLLCGQLVQLESGKEDAIIPIKIRESFNPDAASVTGMVEGSTRLGVHAT